MKIIRNFLAMVVLTIGMYTVQVFADSNHTAAKSKIQVLEQKIVTIQTQINKLEKKGVENFSDDEFIEYDELSDKLLVTMREKTAEQQKIIAEENRKQKAIERTNEKIDSILGSFSSKEKMDKKY